MEYNVKNIDLASEGEKEIEWAKQHMPVLGKIRERFEKEKPFKDITIGVALHIESSTAVLLRTLQAGGAKVVGTGSNPLSTKDDVAAALAKKGAHMFVWRGESEEEYYENLNKVLDYEPEILIDDGADLISHVHAEREEILDNILGSSEETTTGVKRLRAMHEDGELKMPVLAVNDTPAKSLFDNRFGTGESTVNAIMSITNSQIAGKNIVVIGYGYVGRGIAMRAEGLGANVTVVEADPIKGLEAAMKGFKVTNMSKASEYGDIFITATGGFKVIKKDHLENMKDGAMLCNSGHFNIEIDLDGLEELAVDVEEIKEDITEYELEDGRRLHVLAEGRLVNLAGKRSLGHPAEIMDMSFALQALSAKHVLENDLSVNVHNVPAEIDEEVARLKLDSMDIELEDLTDKQLEYEESWELGT